MSLIKPSSAVINLTFPLDQQLHHDDAMFIFELKTEIPKTSRAYFSPGCLWIPVLVNNEKTNVQT
jgi:hypothetical protein